MVTVEDQYWSYVFYCYLLQLGIFSNIWMNQVGDFDMIVKLISRTSNQLIDKFVNVNKVEIKDGVVSVWYNTSVISVSIKEFNI